MASLVCRLDGYEAGIRTVILGGVHKALSPLGLGAPMEEVIGWLGDLPGQPSLGDVADAAPVLLGEMTVGELDNADVEGMTRGAAARSFIEDLSRQRMMQDVLTKLRSGELHTDDLEGVHEASAVAFTAAEAEARGMRFGRGLVRKRDGVVGPELSGMVRELYVLLIPAFLRAGRQSGSRELVSEEYPEGVSKGVRYPEDLIEIIADLVSGCCGHLVGEVKPHQVKRLVQRLHRDAPELGEQIDRLYLSQAQREREAELDA